MLIKFTDRKWALKLVSGEIFANSISNFRKLSDDFGRSDVLEAGMKTINKEDFRTEEIMKNWSDEFLNAIKGNVIYLDEYSKYIKIFSLYKTNEEIIDKRVLEFGDTCVLIEDEEEFIRRICKCLDSEKINIDRMISGDVNYYNNKTETQYLDIFNKKDNLSWQNEYRIVFYPGKYISVFDEDPILLDIGSIRDITKLLDSEEFIKDYNRKIKLEL